MCPSMADIQYATAETRRGKKKRKKIEETTGQKYNSRICYAWAAIIKTPYSKLVLMSMLFVLKAAVLTMRHCVNATIKIFVYRNFTVGGVHKKHLHARYKRAYEWPENGIPTVTRASIHRVK